MTAADPRGPYSATCPTREVLDQLADKWAVLALVSVNREPLRFNALRREMEGVSQKVLTQTLRRLQRNGLVSRTAAATVPVTVTYAITPLGRTLAGVLDDLRQWSVDHIAAVLQARRAYEDCSD